MFYIILLKNRMPGNVYYVYNAYTKYIQNVYYIYYFVYYIYSGSDAASMSEAYGEVVEKGGKLGIIASFNKRYITLAPIAGVVGLAFMYVL